VRYSVVLFDADGTLLDYDHAERFALGETFRHFGLCYDPDHHLPLYRRINEAIWGEFERGLISTDRLPEERVRRLFLGTRTSVKASEFSACYLEAMSEAGFLMDGAAETVAGLRGTCRLGIVTNGVSSVQRSRIRRSGLEKEFACIVVSEDVGVGKPDPAIFEYALRELGYPRKDTVLMVGDALGADVQGAIASGIASCWFNPTHQENTGGLTPTFEIQGLLQLERIV